VPAYQRTPLRYPSRAPFHGAIASSRGSNAASSGASANHESAALQAGKGPATGKINTCKTLDTTTSITALGDKMRIAWSLAFHAGRALKAYNRVMLDLLIRGLSHVLIPMFLVGMVGSAVVVIITLVHDLHDFLSDGGSETSTPESLT
jgi:hypothetical protein